MALEEAIEGVSAKSPLDRVRAVRALGTFKSGKAFDALIAACTK
jgi:hypothetical protein